MQSIFRYPGGKTRKKARDWILSHAPTEYSEYREPFVGGGGIFFSIDTNKNRWINDKDEHLISVYKALNQESESFLERCRSIPTYNKEYKKSEFDRLKKVFNKIAFDNSENQALRFFFVNRTVFAGRVNYERKSRLYFSKPEGWTSSVLARVPDAAGCLKDTRITCGDYADVVLSPGNKVWIYCDPPYVKPFTSTSLLYKHNFTDEDHERLADTLRKCKHNFSLSYEDDPRGLVRSLYKTFNVLTNEWTYAGSWNPDDEGVDRKRRGKELLILNY